MRLNAFGVVTKGVALNATLSVVDACLQNVVSICNWMYKPLSQEKLELMQRNVDNYVSPPTVAKVVIVNNNNNTKR